MRTLKLTDKPFRHLDRTLEVDEKTVALDSLEYLALERRFLVEGLVQNARSSAIIKVHTSDEVKAELFKTIQDAMQAAVDSLPDYGNEELNQIATQTIERVFALALSTALGQLNNITQPDPTQRLIWNRLEATP